MKFHTALLGLAACSLAACGAPQASEPNEEAPAEAGGSPLATTVLTTQTAKSTEEEWGTFAEYFAGTTAGTRDLLSGTATIKPGLEIHPPHRHAEEEFLMVLEGQGEWTVGEEVFTANKGDMLYAAPWDVHGVKNTGDTPLTFVFWKWNSAGLPTPPDPLEAAGEE